MSSNLPLNQSQKFASPWLVAVWPGMGQVAVSAGYYLMAKLEMYLLEEFPQHDFFDMEHIEVKEGLIKTGRFPRNRLFLHQDPNGSRDIMVLLGESQPASGKYAFCQKLVEMARGLGVEKVFTFAAMATSMHPAHDSRVLGVATDLESLGELKRLKVETLQDGQIGGLNGILLAAAAEQGLHGTCLLGEIPHILAQLPFPKASLAVLKVFTMIAELDIDTHELAEQAREIDGRLGELLAEVERMIQPAAEPESDEAVSFDQPPGIDSPEPRIENENKLLIEQLFRKARQDRSQAYELKHELDRLGLYPEYEDRFLDLFKPSE
jgi:proteasome assembly chaperone (PAC2) family protein